MKQIVITSLRCHYFLNNYYYSCDYHAYGIIYACIYARAYRISFYVRLEFRFNCKRDLNVSYLFPTFKSLSIQKENKHDSFPCFKLI